MSQDHLPTFGSDLFPRKPSEVDRFPEAIPTSCEVMTQHRRSEARIDTAEHDAQIRREDISQSRCDVRRHGQFASSSLRSIAKQVLNAGNTISIDFRPDVLQQGHSIMQPADYAGCKGHFTAKIASSIHN
jgi:hypothetical protein